ncbi:MAG: ATP-binding cassette domain-containing protein [Chitinispirillaceae bacterium]|nr:ATP-binding cassette domain-containing protein [Chitinispirillaceae bacterium]
MTGRTFDIAVAAAGRSIVRVVGYPVFDDRITFLFGESGIGKSVISKALYGFMNSAELQIEINEKPYGSHLRDPWTQAIKRNSFFVFQEPSSHFNPLMTINDQLNEGSLAGMQEEDILSRLWRNSSTALIRKLLDVFPKPYRPSGGEKQRILLAMAFKRIDAWIASAPSGEPTYFVFDEPTGSLDNTYRNLFLELLFEKYMQKSFTIVIITHDYSIISEIYNRYRHLIDRVHFKELSRLDENRVAVHDFSAEEYLDWLAAPRPQPVKHLVVDPVLEIQPRFSIFGRRLAIYADSERTRLQPLLINKGDMVYLKAPSGVGKTTLAKIIMGIYRAEQFSMTLDGIAVTDRSAMSLWPSSIWGKRAGMVFQHADESLNLASTVRETFKGLPLKKRLSESALVNYLGELFDGRPVTGSFLRKKVAHLSGGQKQRLNLLRTLILGTGLIILDEPLNGLDFLSVKKVLGLLDEKRAAGVSLLMISHNEEIFEHFIDEENIYYLGEIE